MHLMLPNAALLYLCTHYRTYTDVITTVTTSCTHYSYDLGLETDWNSCIDLGERVEEEVVKWNSSTGSSISGEVVQVK